MSKNGTHVAFATIVSALQEKARKHPESEFIKWLNKDCQEVDALTYGCLWDASSRVVALLCLGLPWAVCKP